MRLIDADALDTLLLDCRNRYSTMLDVPIARTRADEIEAVRITIRKQLPIVEAEPVKHGRWIKMTGMMPPEYHGHYQCSECQWHMKGIRNSWTREEELTYCPNCGAIMDGGEANEID